MREADGQNGPGWRHLIDFALDNGFTPSDEQAVRWGMRATSQVFPSIASTAPKAGDLIVIRLVPGKLDRYAEEIESALKDQIYVRDRLVRVGCASEMPHFEDASSDEPLKATRRDAQQAAIIEVTSEWLRREITRAMRIERFDGRRKAWVTVDCPLAPAQNILQQKSWKIFRPLVAIARAPFLRADGSVCQDPGYDDRTGVFYIPNAEFPRVPERPTREDAQRALAVLLAPFDEYPFAADIFKSAFVAHILSETVRVAIDNCPMFWYSAPRASTGKTECSKMPARIAHGGEPAINPWSENETETRKAVFSSLLVGDRSISFDNLKKGMKVRSETLCAILSSETYRDRVLGVSSAPTVRNSAVLSASGNQIEPAGDLARRSIVIRLDANVEDMKNRTFKIKNLPAHVRAHRPALLISALTIVRAYLDSKAHSGKNPLASFEQWSRMVREPLLWLGMADPADTQIETDEESGTAPDVFPLLAEVPICKSPFTATQLAEYLGGDLGFSADAATPDSKSPIVAALELSGCRNPRDSTAIGWWLRDNRDVNSGGYKLVRTSKSAPTRWALQRVGGLSKTDSKPNGDLL